MTPGLSAALPTWCRCVNGSASMGSPSVLSSLPSTSGVSTTSWRNSRCWGPGWAHLPRAGSYGNMEGQGGPISPEQGTVELWRAGWAHLPRMGELWNYGGLGGPISPERTMGRLLTCFCMQDDSHISMPAYFRFLTLMAFHVFLQEKVHIFPRPCI